MPGRLFFTTNGGKVLSVAATNGQQAWSYTSGHCVAASPSVDDHLIFETFLNVPPCNRPPSSSLTGALIAFQAGTGKVAWRRTLAPSESSPLVAGGKVYVGDWSGKVYAFAEHTGRPLWSTQLGGQVKGGVSATGNRLFVGDYSGHVYSLDARPGRIIWRAGAHPRFGTTVTLYALRRWRTGASTSARPTARSTRSGAGAELRWSQSTSGYVSSSAAVWRDRVYAGSYSHKFTCFDAATGNVIWQFTANGPISGSATVIAGRVYFATLAGRTYALNARTGTQVWTFPDGKYTPVVADADHLYLTGYTRLYGLVERRR